MLRIYGAPKSRARRTLWMAGELGIPFEHKSFVPRAPETRTPEFMALNPNGRVPVIDDDGFILSESMAINFYLAKKHRSPLYPADSKLEALTWQWCLWETDRLDRQVGTYLNHTAMLPEAERKPDIAATAWKEIVAGMDVLEGALAKSEWLVGTAFSLADLNVASAMFQAFRIDLAKWPYVQTWLNRCWDRPAAKKVRDMQTQ